VVSVLHALAHDADNPTAVIATIHQPSSQIYRVFDRIVLLADGHVLYEGEGGFAPAEYFAAQGSPCAPGYNVADHLLDLAHMPPPALALAQQQQQQQDSPSFDKESRAVVTTSTAKERGSALKKLASPTSAAAFLTQLEVLAGREWKVLRRFVCKSFISLAHAA
jgi:ABC-type multidrug transport system ATPase subunit